MHSHCTVFGRVQYCRSVGDTVGDTVSNQKLDGEAKNLVHCSEPWQTCCKRTMESFELQFATHWPFMLVQCMVGDACYELCGQTLFVCSK